MSGHNKWSTIKHKKGAADAKRGKIFTKIIKEITIAAKAGGGNPDGNPRLKTALLSAKSANMPQDNIIRAIKKGTGELEGITYEEVTYEGYGPGGVAVMVDCTTDNKNRTVAEMRRLFQKAGGNMGESGCVNWMFERKGQIIIPKENITEDQIMNDALEAGAEDVIDSETVWEIRTALSDLYAVSSALSEKGYEVEESKISRIPQNFVKVEGKVAEQALRLVEMLEESDDVQDVFANYDIDFSTITEEE
ncbi:MAG TPA: YebC/PmpR family DNA-binding transcriptional regulator [bacterium]|jgi:YebC/PmpR family DNA-binding regulatory protein|nr:YebC/PmpR family DNA-binding transcriptional regulator [bacterium]MDX9805242.1 YebC/PmpR family DNA-binding transcriptional regulator [bacterium]HNW15549.1 YebC/PmpR family DNA-binding transcriptional regulator [bacterium]HNZ53610.1 YebC/PmpR family DNA-binding transcriptional regulator [bacterium]HOG43513.1 YebC/PmpR family DNA-binding transcriptional regulator [bacterium]